MKNRDELITLLKEVIQQDIKHNKKKIKNITTNLIKNGLTNGKVISLLNNANTELDLVDAKILCLLTEQVFTQADRNDLFINDYFSEREIKESQSVVFNSDDEKITFPYTFKKVLKISDDEYMTFMSINELKDMYNSGLIQYNFNTQREAVIKKNKNTIIEVPKVNMKRVKEIANLIKEGRLYSSTLTFNARLGTSNVDTELYYKNDSLTINEGTILDILDGFHRLSGIILASNNASQESDIILSVRILNYSETSAKAYFEQINRTEPVSKNRLQELNVDSLSSFVVNRLQRESELKGKIYTQQSINKYSNSLVSFSALREAIDAYFNIKTKKDAIDISDFLISFFNNLVYTDVLAFQDKIVETREISIKNSGEMFRVYVFIASKAYNNQIPFSNVKKLLDGVNFNRDNNLWVELGIVNQKHQLIFKSNKKLISYFDSLPL